MLFIFAAERIVYVLSEFLDLIQYKYNKNKVISVDVSYDRKVNVISLFD